MTGDDRTAPATGGGGTDPVTAATPVASAGDGPGPVADGEPVLRIEGLRVTFRSGAGTVTAVDGVDLEVGRREVVALVGESGCGKTTLIRAVMGLEKPAAGRVTVDGGTPSRRELSRRVQMIFQDPTGALNPRHTIGRAVAEGLAVQRAPGDHRARSAAALALSGLRPPERFLDRHPHEISGGQRQRALIAGALVLEPELILADEPVASLDASIRGEILALLRSLVDERGISLVVVTHDLGLAWNIADRIAVMYLGRIVEEGTVEEVLADPRHPYTRALLSVVPETAGLAPRLLGGESPDATDIPAGCRFHPRCPALADGTAGRAGVAERCRTADPLLPDGPGHRAACHLAPDHDGDGAVSA